MLDKFGSPGFVGLRFDGGFNDLLGFSGKFVSATGYEELRPMMAKYVYVPRELYDKHLDLVDKFNGEVVERYDEILEAAIRPKEVGMSRDERIEKIKETNRKIRRENDEFFTNPKFR